MLVVGFECPSRKQSKICLPKDLCSCLLTVVSYRALQTHVWRSFWGMLVVLGTSACMCWILPTPRTSFYFWWRCMPALCDLYFCQARGEWECWSFGGVWAMVLAFQLADSVRWDIHNKCRSISWKKPSMFPVDIHSAFHKAAQALWSRGIIEIPPSVALVAIDQNNTSCFLIPSQFCSSPNKASLQHQLEAGFSPSPCACKRCRQRWTFSKQFSVFAQLISVKGSKSEMSWRELLQMPFIFLSVCSCTQLWNNLCLLTAFALALLCWCFSYLAHGCQYPGGILSSLDKCPPVSKGRDPYLYGSWDTDLQNATLTCCLVLRKTLIQACCVKTKSPSWRSLGSSGAWTSAIWMLLKLLSRKKTNLCFTAEETWIHRFGDVSLRQVSDAVPTFLTFL